MADSDSVSVVIPAYNAAGTISETLESVVAQSYRPIEIIVVDDGSADDTAAIVRSRMADIPYLRLLTQANQGVSAARNAGIRAAKGAFIAFVDADDLWHPDKIALQVARFRSGGDRLGVVYTWAIDLNRAGNTAPGRGFSYSYEGNIYAPLLVCNFINNTLMVRRECFDTVGLYDTAIQANEDLKMHLALAEHYDFGVVPRFLAGYRVWTNGLAHDIAGLRRTQDQLRERTRREHPHLPRWLYRWSESNNLWNLGVRALRAGRYGEGVQMFGRTFVRDPGFLFQPAFRAALKGVVRRALGRGGAARNGRAPEQYHFLDPRAEANIVPPARGFSDARMSRIASLQARAKAQNVATVGAVGGAQDFPAHV
jgi:glycosyltransferase involved in cell wall biosynthesis